MGLQGQLNDISSDSILFLLVALICTAVRYIRSFFHSIGLLRSSWVDAVNFDDELLSFLGSGLGGLILITEQGHHDCTLLSSSQDCAVCLCGLREGDRVRYLPCNHVFHKHCFNGWVVDRLNFTCPICRSSVLLEDHLTITGRRVGAAMIAWFSSVH